MSTHDLQPGDIVSIGGKERLVVKCPDKYQLTDVGNAPDICWLAPRDRRNDPGWVLTKDVTFIQGSRSSGKEVRNEGICQDCHGKGEIVLLTSTVQCKCKVGENGK